MRGGGRCAPSSRSFWRKCARLRTSPCCSSRTRRSPTRRWTGAATKWRGLCATTSASARETAWRSSWAMNQPTCGCGWAWPSWVVPWPASTPTSAPSPCCTASSAAAPRCYWSHQVSPGTVRLPRPFAPPLPRIGLLRSSQNPPQGVGEESLDWNECVVEGGGTLSPIANT